MDVCIRLMKIAHENIATVVPVGLGLTFVLVALGLLVFDCHTDHLADGSSHKMCRGEVVEKYH